MTYRAELTRGGPALFHDNGTIVETLLCMCNSEQQMIDEYVIVHYVTKKDKTWKKIMELNCNYDDS